MSDSARAKIAELVARFEANYKQYTSPQYNETEVRAQFVDPFFEALGWDVRNQEGRFEVSLETYVQVEESGRYIPKRPDYGFRIQNQTRFFVETKKPSVNLKTNPLPAFQVRRYGWSAKLPVSILTDFEELIIYDCRIQPSRDDAPQKGRLRYYHFREYVEKWDEIAGLFSYDAVLNNKLEAWVQETKQRGTVTVDDAFLNEMETWRKRLAEDIALHNPQNSRRELNMAVQTTIDRIVFLRICEDRGVEPYGRLKDFVKSGRVYENLAQLFRQADAKYNSGLFHFSDEKGREEPDTLTLDLKIGDDTLQDIIARLYYPTSPYEFSVLPADILGQVYERFLGKVIELTPGGGASVTEKPEVRKAGGVYYTPTYIVDYIVQNTVGKLVEGKTPAEVARLKILDPACGSGSFLIGAYQYLLDWHLKWYIADGAAKYIAKRANQTSSLREVRSEAKVAYVLSTAEKKRILLNNIYGVDLDQQAVEVTKLSLLLKVLEGETAATAQPELLSERVLPDLGDNIKWGNSLIGPDFYAGKQISMFDEEETYRVKVFDWHSKTEGFGAIMAAGGFDAVIGNPPWGAEFSEMELEYHRGKNREIIVRMIDSFMYFVFQAHKKLKIGASLGMILPDVILYQIDNAKLRNFLLNYRINRILNMGDVFDKVTRPSSIVIYNNIKSPNGITVGDFAGKSKTEKPHLLSKSENFTTLPQELIGSIPNNLFITKNISNYSIWKKLKDSPHKLLADLVDSDGIQRGVSPDLKEAFLVDTETVKKLDLELIKLKRVITGGRHLKRYNIEYPDLWLIYTTRSDNFADLPNICNYIDGYRDQITCKEVKENKHPLYSLHRPREESIFLKSTKLLGVITEDEIIIAPDSSGVYATDGIYLFDTRDNVNKSYLMGILNSKLFVFTYRLLALEEGRVLAQVKPTTLIQLPIRTIDFDNPADKARHDKMVGFVQSMLDLHKQLADASSPQIQKTIQSVIDSTDREIDALVYELYGLTDDEIAIVEGR